MAYSIWQQWAGCSTCNIDSTSCPWTNEIPAAANGLNGMAYNGFTVQDHNGVIIQNFNVQSGEFRVQNYLDILKEWSKPLFTQFMSNYKTIARLLFDIDEIYDESKYGGKVGSEILLFKNFPTAPVLPSDDGVSFIYQEQAYTDVVAYIARDEAVATDTFILHDGAGRPINLNDPKYRGLYEVGKTILVTSNGNNIATPTDPDCCASMIQRVIVGMGTVVWNGPLWNLNYPSITVEVGDLPTAVYKGINVAPNTVVATLNDDYGNVYKGDSVRALYKSRNDCDQISGEANNLWTSMKRSYIQHFGKVLKFEKYELNRSYADMEGVAGFITKEKIGPVTRMLMEEIAYTFYMGQNRGSTSTISYTNPLTGKVERPWSDTMGLIPHIHRANLAFPEKRIITSMKNLRTPEEKASLIVDQMIQAQQSGAVNTGDSLVLLMDTKAYSTYNRLLNAFTKLTGAVYQTTDNVKKNFVTPELFTPYGTVEIMTCPIFERITGNSGNMMFIPKKLIMLKQRENHAYTLESGSIMKSTLGFQTVDITVKALHWHECQTYNVFGEFSIILWLVESGAYRWIQNCF